MRCPRCNGPTRVVDSRDTDYSTRYSTCVELARKFDEEGVARERYCRDESCGAIFYTIEKELKSWNMKN